MTQEGGEPDVEVVVAILAALDVWDAAEPRPASPPAVPPVWRWGERTAAWSS